MRDKNEDALSTFLDISLNTTAEMSPPNRGAKRQSQSGGHIEHCRVALQIGTWRFSSGIRKPKPESSLSTVCGRRSGT